MLYFRHLIPRFGRQVSRVVVRPQHAEAHRTPELGKETMNCEVSNYPGHIPLTRLQKFLLSCTSGITLFFNPQRADLLSSFGESTGECALAYVYKQMLNHPDGIRILRDRPSIRSNTVDLDKLRSLPQGTFGRAYTNFIDRYGYSPDDRNYVKYVHDPELAYVMLRYREVHDLVHTLLEQPTDMLGEVVVKWVEGIQTRLPMCLTGGYFGSLRLAPKQTRLYLDSHLDYALRTGREGNFLMCVYFEEHWADDLKSFRDSLHIHSPPYRPQLKQNSKNYRTND